eukprot:3287642-Prymnesium_polylepis.1
MAGPLSAEPWLTKQSSPNLSSTQPTRLSSAEPSLIAEPASAELSSAEFSVPVAELAASAQCAVLASL